MRLFSYYVFRVGIAQHVTAIPTPRLGLEQAEWPKLGNSTDFT